MKKSILNISLNNKVLSNSTFNSNFDFINQNCNNLFDGDKNFANNKYEDYVKVKYLKGKR